MTYHLLVGLLLADPAIGCINQSVVADSDKCRYIERSPYMGVAFL